MCVATSLIFNIDDISRSDWAHIFAYEPLITISIISLHLCLCWQEPQGHNAYQGPSGPPRPPNTEPTMNGVSHTPATANSYAYGNSRSGEHTLDKIALCTIFVHLNCQIVNIRLGEFVYSCYLRLSVYTQYVCRPACVCARALTYYTCMCVFDTQPMLLTLLFSFSRLRSLSQPPWASYSAALLNCPCSVFTSLFTLATYL